MIFGISWNILGDGLSEVFQPVSHHDFYKPPFWSKLFRKKKQKETPAYEPPLFAMEPATPSSTRSDVISATIYPQDTSNASNAILLTAREHVSMGRLPEALHAYQHLIQHGRLIPEILPDLAVVVKNHPQDSKVWQTLGDALSRAGDEVHAAQSYDRAKKLMG
jgi:hypothetical protein